MPSMPESLAYQTGPSGERFLISSGDGKSLATKSGCGGCCGGGPCQTVQKFVACPTTPSTEPCANGPTVVWVCIPGVLCGGGAIKWRNRCYTPASPAEIIPVGNLNPGDILLRNGNGSDPEFNYYCLASCLDPACTQCRQYLRCSVCAGPGVGSGGGSPPEVYIRRELVNCCGLAGGASNPQGTAWCYTVSPASQGVREDQLPPGAVILDGPVACGFDCCDCAFQNCGGRFNGTVTECSDGSQSPLSCCCPRAWGEIGEYRFHQIVRTPGLPQVYSTLDATGFWNREYVNASPVGPTPTIPHTLTNYFPGGSSVSNYDVPVPHWECGQDPGWLVVDYQSPDAKCPWQIAQECGGTWDGTTCTGLDGSRYVVEFAIVRVGCNALFMQGSWKFYDGTGNPIPQRETTVLIRFLLTARDPCGSNCSGITTLNPRGVLPRPMGPIGTQPGEGATPIPQPLPFAQWPAGAKLVALRKQPGDIGVGSTIEREAGLVGLAFKAAMKAAKIDCGCSGRKNDYDARFPY